MVKQDSDPTSTFLLRISVSFSWRIGFPIAHRKIFNREANNAVKQANIMKKFKNAFFLRIKHIIYHICHGIQPKYIDFNSYSW
ncbi:MAG: hypothetical protein A2047_03270 [Omnitrophica bacterium GWA2_41_15]|nr:MAG: hypothetical protein A2047_03270 [Omnitrophica bacterium GWA2_41_15]